MATANVSVGTPDDESGAAGSEHAMQVGGTVPDLAPFEPDGCDSTTGCWSGRPPDQPCPGSAFEDEAVVQKQAEQLPGLETY